jgi:hypothetical protein
MGKKMEIIEFNFSTYASPKLVKLGKGTTPTERKEFLALIREFEDVFVWSYGDLKSLMRDVIQHDIPLKEDEKPFRQKLRQINPNIAPHVQKELQKMVGAGIIEPSRYSS